MPSTPASRKTKLLWAVLATLSILALLAIVYWSRSSVPAPTGERSAATATPATPAASVPPAAPAMVPHHIYSETADPKADIAAGLAQARREHKRVILDFGGDWCGDCQVLDIYFHQTPNSELLAQHYVLVHVWIGQMDANIDLAAHYGVPIAKGVPALAVLAPDGRVLFAQQSGQFDDMRNMQSASVTEFLEKWKT